ncbi:hypothetical protein LWI29_015101 [Acer saccharum]|uniref:Uncharacterized protein n=1 Tax=Acer saccharum TaxID=4024 RepID=A0AA39RCN8_ACESA|nr:hypothetical protein LWI29_015101 [Acer saccharum]
MVAIYNKGDDLTKYVDKWYFKDTYKKCYSSVLHGIRMENLWFKTNMPPLLPPIDVKQAGRPRKLRIKEIGEIPPNARKIARLHKMYTCSKCHQAGHSAKTYAKRAELQAKLKKKVYQIVKDGGVAHEVQSEVEAETQPEYEDGVLTLEHAEANDPLEWFGNLSDVLNTLRFDPNIVEKLRAFSLSLDSRLTNPSLSNPLPLSAQHSSSASPPDAASPPVIPPPLTAPASPAAYSTTTSSSTSTFQIFKLSRCIIDCFLVVAIQTSSSSSEDHATVHKLCTML